MFLWEIQLFKLIYHEFFLGYIWEEKKQFINNFPQRSVFLKILIIKQKLKNIYKVYENATYWTL